VRRGQNFEQHGGERDRGTSDADRLPQRWVLIAGPACLAYLFGVEHAGSEQVLLDQIDGTDDHYCEFLWPQIDDFPDQDG
jgi:hypothetical protein